jgi:hypothetical protein
VYTRALAYICTCVSECVSDRVVCAVYIRRVCIMLLCCTLRARAAQNVRLSATGGARSRRAKRPAPRPTVRGPPRDRPKRASDVPARRTSTVLGGRAPILPRARAHFRHPWTAADPWATAAVAAVLYRWWRCAPAGLPPPPPRGISPVRAYYTRLRRRCVRECVRARYVRRAVSVSHSIIS